MQDAAKNLRTDTPSMHKTSFNKTEKTNHKPDCTWIINYILFNRR